MTKPPLNDRFLGVENRAERSMCGATFDFALLIGDLANKALFDKKDLPF